MKRTIAIIAIIVLTSFRTNDGAKKLKVEGTQEQFAALYQVIDQSNAPHLQVEAAKAFILEQLKPQLDSTNKKK